MIGATLSGPAHLFGGSSSGGSGRTIAVADPDVRKLGGRVR